MALNTFPVVLEDTFMLSPSVKHFVFRSNQEIPFHYLPGQFITIHFEHEGHLLKRSYSIANAPTQNNRIELSAGFVAGGPGTELLFHLSPGDQISISGPYGRLILKDEIPKRYILVATSTGVTPYRAMLPELKKRIHAISTLEVIIIQGVQTREDVLFLNEFLDFVHHTPRTQFRAQLSRHNASSLLDYEHTGYVQHAFTELQLNPAQDLVYLCGNPGMIDDSFNDLKAMGFSMPQVIREKYISR